MRGTWMFIACLSLVACSRDETPDTAIGPPRNHSVTGLVVTAPVPRQALPSYPIHRNITATVFWVGEPPSRGSPTNSASAWDERWEKHFGGFDDPRQRDGYSPRGIVLGENPFYVALPYNDFRKGRRAGDAAEVIPWFKSRQWTPRDSACKNRWVRITRGERVAYAQWEDVGPFVSDDTEYVFGSVSPRNSKNQNAGIDLSPAVRDCLGILGGSAKVDWQFVDEAGVPAGPWRRVVTRSQIDWE